MSDNRTFVSYSRADSEFALKLASDLRANGASIWLDQLDIAPGARWDSAIEDALRRSARVIVLLSPKAVASQNVLDEVSFALDEGKTIVPVLVETCAIPMRLRRLQYVDFTAGYEAALGRMLVTLGVARTTVSQTTTPPPEPEPSAPQAQRPEPDPPFHEPLRDFATPAASAASGQRTMLFAGVAAAIVVFVGVAIWMSSRPDGSLDTSTDAGVDTSASAAPAETPAPDNTAAPPPAASPAAPAANPNTGSSAISGLINGGTLTLPSAADGEPGLKGLLGVTRRLAAADTLTAADLEELADAESRACRGQSPTSPCVETASGHVQSTIRTVCSRKLSLGQRPADELGALKYDRQINNCFQEYTTIMVDRMHRGAQEAIRNIKPG